ncbi:MAG: serine hydrolase [Erythrobacter sp.]|nr:MAG: serine hydrolase [Erythrobacter sp.]
MIRPTMLAAAALLLAPLPAAAQNVAQVELDARYARALAAGYKALMLCGAIANAERAGIRRNAESVMEWEMAGIQDPLDEIVGWVPYEVVRAPNGEVYYVTANWSAELPDRVAVNAPGEGCAIQPIGFDPLALPVLEEGDWPEPERRIQVWHDTTPDYMRAVFDAAFSGTYGADSRTTALIVDDSQNRVMWDFDEDFDPFTPQRTWSVAKSIAATLIGAAVQRGEADVTASVGLGESETDPRRAITIDNLLRMASGRYTDTPGNRTDPLYFGGATVDEVALDWPLIHAPGSTYRYANNDTLAAVQAIEHTFADHPPAELFAQLGMDRTVAETDWQGNYILSSQVWSTGVDLLRLGQLHLNDGVLPDGTRILPEGWVDYVTTPSGPQPPGAFGYGAGWWLMNNSAGVPPDTFFANGNRGQYVVVVPSRSVVIVRRGEDPAGGSGFDIAAFTRDVLAALEE